MSFRHAYRFTHVKTRGKTPAALELAPAETKSYAGFFLGILAVGDRSQNPITLTLVNFLAQSKKKKKIKTRQNITNNKRDLFSL